MKIYRLYWSPTGQKIAEVEASTKRAAVRKAPAPYSRHKGEIYAEEVDVARRAIRSRNAAMGYRGSRGAKLIPAKLKRMSNGRYKVFVAPGAVARMHMNPAGRIKAGYYVITTSDGHSVSQLFKTKAAAVRMAKRFNRSEGWGKYQVRKLGGEVVFAE